MKSLRKHTGSIIRRKPLVIEETDWEVARDIMGEDFFGTKQIFQALGNFWLEESVRSISYFVPFSETTLKKCKIEGFKLFLGISSIRCGETRFGLTIKFLRGKFPDLFGEKDNFSSYRFANRTVIKPAEWYLVKGSVAEESRKKSYQDQEKILNENECREKAVVYIYLMCLMHKIRGERLFDGSFIWCSDRNGDEGRVFTGFSNEVININWFKEHNAYEKLCLVPVRKPDL